MAGIQKEMELDTTAYTASKKREEREFSQFIKFNDPN
jgi:hypothetical protein